MAPESRKTASQKAQGAGASRAWEALTPALSEWILEAVSAMGFSRMTPVQASTMPLFMSSKDVVVEAVTGSGKTLAFLIPIVERLLRLEEPIRRHHIGAIIISPTRELASQIHSVLLTLLRFHTPSAAAIASASGEDPSASPEPSRPDNIDTPALPTSAFPSSTLRILPQLLLGGTSSTPAQDLSYFLTHSPNLLISTPGRLLELLSSPHVHAPQSSFEVLVLDEADRLLDLGFKDDLQKILKRLPKQRRTGLFSASVSEAVDQLVRVGLRNPVKVSVKVKGAKGAEEQRTPASLQMTYLTVPPTRRLLTLLSLLHNLQPRPQKAIAYLSTCAAVDHFAHALTTLQSHFYKSTPPTSRITIIPLHGKHPPSVRAKNYNLFTTSSNTSPTLLLTTDLASRGLDIPAVDLTLQLDPPSDPKTFLHRAGRAGRAGRPGLSICFLLPGRETESYPPFLSVRKTPVIPLQDLFPNSDHTSSDPNQTQSILHSTLLSTISDSAASEATSILQTAALKDRAIHDCAQRAFVSWVRSYRAHAATSIFRVGDLQWEELCKGWGLLRVPKMPELKMRKAVTIAQGEPTDGELGNKSEAQQSQVLPDIDRTLGLRVSWDTYSYANPAQEAKRLAALPATNPSSSLTNPAQIPLSANSRVKKIAFSNNKSRKETAALRRERKAAKREAVHVAQLDEKGMKERREVEGLVEKVRREVERREREEAEEEFRGFD